MRTPAFAILATLAASLLPGVAGAGPPFLTDDPEPTATGHWEIYAPSFDAAGRGDGYDGALGVELNYGVAQEVQLTVGLPMGYTHDVSGLHVGHGDAEVSVKHRVFHDEAAEVSVAVFPGMTLPTASHGMGARRITALLPVWAQKDTGPWSVFGGGGYAINPGAGNRDYWTGGVAVARTFSKGLLAGVEIDRQGAETVGGHASTSLGLGGIAPLGGGFRLLASGGPTFTDGEGAPGFHAFVALGVDF